MGRLASDSANRANPSSLQLEQVAAHREIKTYALIQPHFAAISPLLISSKPTAPAILAAALDCFHQSHESLLRITREYTLPTIVAQEQKQMLEQVAAASAQTVPVMLTHGPSAAAVLAYLFMRPDNDTTNRGLKFFINEVNSLGNNLRLGQVLGSVKVPLVYKLALELGDEDPVVSAQVSLPFSASISRSAADTFSSQRPNERSSWSSDTQRASPAMPRSSSVPSSRTASSASSPT